MISQKNKTLAVLLILISVTKMQSQATESITYGLKIGGLQSRISNLPEMIIGRDNTLATYEVTTAGYLGTEGGVFVNFKLPDSRVAIQPEIMFRKAGDIVNYNNMFTGKTYKLTLNYSYLVIGGVYKIYPLKGANISIGCFYAVNLDPNNLEYESNTENGIYDTTTRQFFRDGINGLNDFSISTGLGYEFPNSLHFDLRYYFGVSDMIKSRDASFQFIENSNRSNILSFSIGYSFHNWN